jgi:hypothetical protein
MDTVKQEAQTFAAAAQDKAIDRAEQTKETASRTVADFANAVRRAADELSQSDQSAASRIVQQAANGLESLSRSVSDKRPEELLDAVRDFGRRNPTAFVAGSVLIGLALARFVRSSAQPKEDGGNQFQSQALAGSSDAYGQSSTPYDDAGAPREDSEFAASGEGFSDAPDVEDAEEAFEGDDRDRARFSPEV